MTCVLRARESGPAEEGLRKVPDIHKDDLAQRRIQGGHAPPREAPRFVSGSSSTAADLETWERLKVSGHTRCVMFSPAVALLNFEGIQCLAFDHFLFSWLEIVNASQNTEYILHEVRVINTKVTNHGDRKLPL